MPGLVLYLTVALVSWERLIQLALASAFQENTRHCNQRCYLNGNCNGETGTCDCPYGFSGKSGGAGTWAHMNKPPSCIWLCMGQCPHILDKFPPMPAAPPIAARYLVVIMTLCWHPAPHMHNIHAGTKNEHGGMPHVQGTFVRRGCYPHATPPSPMALIHTTATCRQTSTACKCLNCAGCITCMCEGSMT